MKKSLGYILPSAILIAGIGSIIINVKYLAFGSLTTYIYFTSSNQLSYVNTAYLQNHTDIAKVAGTLVFSLLLITLLLSALILIFQKKLSIVALRVVAIAAASAFFLRPTVWGIFQSTSMTTDTWQSSKIQQEAYIHFIIGSGGRHWEFASSYYSAGLLLLILLGLQVVWTFQIKEDPEVAAEKARLKEAEEVAAAERRAAYAEAQKKREAEKVASRPVFTPAAPASKNLSSELASLTALHQSGALTDEEFAVAKKRILGS